MNGFKQQEVWFCNAVVLLDDMMVVCVFVKMKVLMKRGNAVGRVQVCE